MLLKGTGPSRFMCVISASEKMLHNTRVTAPPLMSARMVRSSPSLCRLPAAAPGGMVTLKLTPGTSVTSLEVVFTIIAKPYGGCFGKLPR